MCLTAYSDDNFAPVIYSKCTDGNLNQVFYMEKDDGKFSGKIKSYRSYLSHNLTCLHLEDVNLKEQKSVIMSSNCTDEWEILQTGALRHVQEGKCIGWEEESNKTVAVECDSVNTDTWVAIDSDQYRLFNLRFKTSGALYSPSSGPFEITAYGDIPTTCHSTYNAKCDIELYGKSILNIRAKTSNAWRFSIEGDIGDLIWHRITATVGKPVEPPVKSFPTWMGVYTNYDIIQLYTLKPNISHECYNIHFKTSMWEHAASSGVNSFRIDGYGYVPSNCHSMLGAECDIQICGRRTLVIRAYTTDEWQFELSGDVNGLRESKRDENETRLSDVLIMDIDRYDYLQVHNLVRAG